MTNYSKEVSAVFSGYTTSDKEAPSKYFPLDYKDNKTKSKLLDNNELARIKESHEFLWNKCGGMDNLVFFSTEEKVYNADGNVYPLYVTTTGDTIMTESVFKVKDLSLVSEKFKPQVEVFED